MRNLIVDPPDDGCVFYLSGAPGGGNRIYDVTPWGNHGTITGAAWARLPGGIWCLTFDGVDDNVACAGDGILNITGDLTAVAWFKCPSASGDRVIVGKDRDGVAEEAWFVRVSGHTIQFRVCKAGGWTTLTGNFTIDDDVFHQVVARYRHLGDGSSLMDIIVDGRPDASLENAVGPIQSTLNPVTVGQKHYTGYEQYFTGQIALPRLYNRHLSLLEVQRLFQTENSLFGVW
jgi:hypothetical protein